MKNSDTKSAAKKAAPKKAAAKSAPQKSAAGSKGGKAGSSEGKVSANSEAAEGLRDLLVDCLKDMYYAEKALTKALPKMAKNATSEELVSAINEHVEVTQNQIERLEQVFEAMEEKAQAKKCEAIEGLIKEGQEIMESTKEGVVRDAGIIAASQKIEHYEIASYGTMVAFANALGEDEVAALLEETLAEEKEADSMLSEIAESAINVEAAEGDEEEEEEED